MEAYAFNPKIDYCDLIPRISWGISVYPQLPESAKQPRVIDSI